MRRDQPSVAATRHDLMPSAAQSSSTVNSMVTITGTGDHDRPEWLITVAGIRNLREDPRQVGIFVQSGRSRGKNRGLSSQRPARCCRGQGVLSESNQKSRTAPSDHHIGRLCGLAPRRTRDERYWRTTGRHDVALVEVSEQLDRAGSPRCETTHRSNARLQSCSGPQRSRSQGSNYCVAFRKDNSTSAGYTSKKEVRLISGMRCLQRATNGDNPGPTRRLSPIADYLHQSRCIQPPRKAGLTSMPTALPWTSSSPAWRRPAACMVAARRRRSCARWRT